MTNPPPQKVRAEKLQAAGDRQLMNDLRQRPEVQAATSAAERHEGPGARRRLLATSLRLTPPMAPDVAEVLETCRRELAIETPLELFVYPSADYNAATLKPEGGRLLVMVSSSLLEGFDADELRFVMGHELGHNLFEHHSIPTHLLLERGRRIDPALALKLFAWQRYAEISCDRAGLVCAGDLQPAARALFKLASGLSGTRVKVDIDQFVAQMEDLAEETRDFESGDAAPRRDWFATHPFSPLRLGAARIFARSELMTVGGRPMAQVELEVDELMSIMNPSYLQDPAESAEAMRRLLFAAGILMAHAGGRLTPETLTALERLLGAGRVPGQVDVEALRADLPRRIAAVIASVTPLRRGQVLRDLCVLARADGRVTDPEQRLLLEIADQLGVSTELIACTIESAGGFD